MATVEITSSKKITNSELSDFIFLDKGTTMLIGYSYIPMVTVDSRRPNTVYNSLILPVNDKPYLTTFGDTYSNKDYNSGIMSMVLFLKKLDGELANLNDGDEVDRIIIFNGIDFVPDNVDVHEFIKELNGLTSKYKGKVSFIIITNTSKLIMELAYDRYYHCEGMNEIDFLYPKISAKKMFGNTKGFLETMFGKIRGWF